ncbi:alpha-L-glutamate ligase [Tumebacillus avium]|uniref:Alpha-L-glutamate ligase n=1 Tax=Tumebacillus avium TaxID=1903704 RepID=A0A1Y0IN59_9BACL|nr:YheC/YheD family protein [Tumebacillus avium]ARU61971.1 alpha-L-glutamate ligase [Tumebacillus avium]
MTLVGFLHTRKDPRKILKLYAFAAAAKAEGVEFFYFTAGRVNLNERTIRGLVLENGSWVEQNFPFPDVVYNDSSPSGPGEEVIDELREIIPFTARSVGDKMTVYERIEEGRRFDQYLIPSLEVRDPQEVLRYLKKHEMVIFKPVWGHQGIGVVRLEKKDGDYTCLEKGVSVTYNKQELSQFLQERLDEVVHLVQPFIITKTRAGQAYDFRLHVQKNGSGDWVITSIYPRVAPSGSIIANLSSGGYAAILRSFLEHEFAEQAYDIQRDLEQFALGMAAHMDEIYDESFDELGIDVGLDEKGKIWLFEVNWKPGVPPVFYLELDVAKNSIGYAAYLAGRKGRK